MKCISLWQPWASLIAYEKKLVETRSWATSYRGPIAIHAAKRWTREEQEICKTEPFKTALRGITLPFGAIIATATLADCLPMGGSKGEVAFFYDWVKNLSDTESDFGFYDYDRFGWIFENVQRLPEPIPYKGAQGLFEVYDNLFGIPMKEREADGQCVLKGG